jgi:hypothetical protein
MDPIVNLEEAIGKTVGRTVPSGDFVKAATTLQRTSVSFHKAFKNPFLPKGVYRFRSHEEADAWVWKMITRKK